MKRSPWRHGSDGPPEEDALAPGSEAVEGLTEGSHRRGGSVGVALIVGRRTSGRSSSSGVPPASEAPARPAAATCGSTPAPCCTRVAPASCSPPPSCGDVGGFAEGAPPPATAVAAPPPTGALLMPPAAVAAATAPPPVGAPPALPVVVAAAVEAGATVDAATSAPLFPLTPGPRRPRGRSPQAPRLRRPQGAGARRAAATPHRSPVGPRPLPQP